MRVLHAQTGDGLGGGIATYVSSLCRQRKPGSVEYIATCSDPSSSVAKELYGDTTCVRLPATYTPLTMCAFIRRLVQVCRVYQCQCIHAHALRAAATCIAAGIIAQVPVVYTNHGLRFSQKTAWHARIAFYIGECIICTLAKHVVCVRQSDYEMLSAMMPWLRKKMSVIRTRIDRAIASDVEVREPSNHVLLGVGTIIPVKNPHLFIRWLQMCKRENLQFTAKWLGDGPMRTECVNITRRNSLPIEWPGHVTPAQVTEEMSQASLLLITSDYESGPITALEAMAVGLPVIVRRFRGVSDVIQDNKTGLIISGHDEEFIGKRIAALLNNSLLRAQMAINARWRFNELFCDTSRMLDEYEALYRKLLI